MGDTFKIIRTETAEQMLIVVKGDIKMKSMKKTISAITLVIVGLVIASSATAMISSQTSNEDISTSIAMVQSQPIKLIKETSSTGRAGSQITTQTYNEYHPSVADAPAGIFYAMAEVSEDGSIWQPTVYSSDATGETWAAEVTFTYPGCQYTALDSNSVGTYGTFGAPPDVTSQVVYFKAEDPEGDSGVWDWSSVGEGFFNLFYNDIACYNDPNANATALGWNLALTGDYGTAYGVPMIMYREFGPNDYGLMSRSVGRTGYVHAANSADQEKVLVYNVFDREDGANLFVRVVNVGIWNYNSANQYWTHPDKKSLEIPETTFQVKYPSIAAKNDNVIIVAQKINGASNDIICYYSTNGLSTRNSVMIAESADNETYPQIVIIEENTAICTYYKNNVLYFKSTENGGATWSAETQVSDSQPNVEYRGEGLCSKLGSAYSVWEDTRNGNVDIYFDKLSFHIPTPDVQIGIVAGGVGKVTMEVKNVGDADATNVPWSISVQGGILKLIDVTTTGNISTLAASGTQTVQTDKFIFGFGAITIQLTAGSTSASKTGKVLLILVRNVA
jgi:hypothetical protein